MGRTAFTSWLRFGERYRVWVSPLVVILATLAFRTFRLRQVAGGQGGPAWLELFLWDAALLSSGLTLALLAPLLGRWGRSLAHGTLWFSASWYAADAATLYSFFTPLRAGDMLFLASEPSGIGMVPPAYWVALGAVVLSLVPWKAKIEGRARVFLSSLTLVLFVYSVFGAKSPKFGFGWRWFFDNVRTSTWVFFPSSRPNIPKFSPDELRVLLGDRPSDTIRKSLTADLPSDKPPIIVLLVEAMGSIISRAVSGLPGYVPRFDALAPEGRLFLNYFTGCASSFCSIVSMLHGVVPAPYPSEHLVLSSLQLRSLNGLFERQPSLLDDIKAKGYYTVFATIGVDVIQITLDYTRAIGFDEVLFLPDRVRTSAGRYVPKDADMYRYVLDHLGSWREKGKPLFLVLQSAETHRSPDAPRWTKTDQALEFFVKQLKEIRFFDLGNLVIVGDHPPRRAKTPPEIDRYGDSADARVAMLLLGKGVSPGIDERLLGHRDFLRNFSRVLGPGSELTDFTAFVDYYANPVVPLRIYSPYFPDGLRRSVKATSIGKGFEWKTDSAKQNAYGSRIREAIQRQSATLQYLQASPKLRRDLSSAKR